MAVQESSRRAVSRDVSAPLLLDRYSHYTARLACLPLNVSLIRQLQSRVPDSQYQPPHNFDGMERLLKPERLDCDSNSTTAAHEWRHWLQTFKTFIAVLPQENLNKLGLLINFVSPKIYESISECTTYDDALTTLQSQFVKPTNEVFARHRLATRRQEPGESLDVYFRALKILSKECNFKAVTATQHCEEYIRDAHGLSIRRRKTYGGAPSTRLLSAVHENSTNVSDLEPESVLAASATKAKCFFCGLLRHPRSKCPARDAVCHKCQKKGHFSKVCRTSSVSGSVTPNNSAMLATITSAATPSILSKAVARVSINGIEADGLIDSGSSESFIHPDLVKRHSLNVQHSKSAVTMASTSLSAHTSGVCKVNIKVNGRDYESVRLTVLPKLCSSVILGQDFQKLHESVQLNYGGDFPPLVICGLGVPKIDPPELFANLTADCHPVAAKSRRYSTEDREFIEKEVQRLLKEGIIEPSNSPWRAQVVVVKGESRKMRLAIDYSETINKFTLLDSYPLPRIDETVNKMAQYRIFSTIDLRSAYHQVAIKDTDKLYTAFEAGGKLYQFARIPFGVTNGVACFQRIMDSLIKEEGLVGTYAYLDNVTICGMTQQEHDGYLNKFLEAAARRNMTYNEDKCTFST
ncbi:uncharacterized protein K02A2.6 [Penaeus vannamei]|uniref:uncharacterized protein K02A2.6 n=1 Tax=Penaeus vannamei TaxID=6689 RepID=UPI00387FB057